jgi:hypothetical protein
MRSERAPSDSPRTSGARIPPYYGLPFIHRTLEYLETLGVPVIGFGVEEFPAFYSRKSGAMVSHPLDTAAEVAPSYAGETAVIFTYTAGEEA